MDKKTLIRQLKTHNFSNRIISAFEKVDRKKFVPEEYRKSAYQDTALPIGKGQTISQPYTIAFMLTLLKLDDKQKILEVGSGSGYVLELLSNISKDSKIFGIETIKELAENSKEKLKHLDNVKVIHGNGSKGLKSKAPFNRILVSAAAQTIPQKLVNQLKFRGVLVVPVKNSIVSVEKTSGQNKIKEYKGFSFVPLV